MRRLVAAHDAENGYGSDDDIGVRVLELPSMQAIAAVLRRLPESDLHALPADVRDWVLGDDVQVVFRVVHHEE